MNWPSRLPSDTIDALAYYGSWPHWVVPESDEEGLLRRMDRLRIRSAVALSLRSVFSDANSGNEELAGLIQRHPGRFAGMATYDPHCSVPPTKVMERARDAGLTGLALFPPHHGYSLGKEPLIEEALYLAKELNWPVVIPIRLVMCWWLPVAPIESILETAERHRSVSIMAACARELHELDAIVGATAELPNLHMEISGAQTLNAVTELVTRAHPSRVLFGTGQPIQIPECSLIKLANGRVKHPAQDAILRANANRVFGFENHR